MRRVVVTGMGIISPLGNDIDVFWNNLISGVCGIGYITRFDTEGYKVKVAAEVKDFEPSNYMERSETRRMDLYSQYAMASAVLAMNDSNMVSGENIDSERLGVYMGSGVGGISTFMTESDKLREKGPTRISPFFIPMMISNMAAGQISIRFNAQGPSLPVVTACATSTNTIGEAFRAIRHGYADAIIAGGCEAPIIPIAVAGFTNCMALSLRNDPLDCCTPFDKRRDGFIMAEGAGSLILEEYEHAKARGAKIYGEIAGYGNTSDAFHITAPHPEAIGGSRAIALAMAEAGLTPCNADKMYINAHGTSTPLNDKLETLAIKKALGKYAQDVRISSTKSMTGHMLGAAGVAEAIASLLTIDRGIIPPTIGYKEPDPECDLNYVPNKSIQADIDCAVSLSLGFGGHNAAIAIKRV